MATSKLKNYLVGAHIHIRCGTDIKAESLEHAASLAKQLEIDDFVTLKAGGINDSRLEIIQVYDADSEL